MNTNLPNMTDEKREKGKALALEGGFLAGLDIIEAADRSKSDSDRTQMVLAMLCLFESEFINGLKAAFLINTKLPPSMAKLSTLVVLTAPRQTFTQTLNGILEAMVKDTKSEPIGPVQ